MAISSIKLTCWLLTFCLAVQADAIPLHNGCVNVWGFLTFYTDPGRLPLAVQKEIREAMARDYPNLHPILGRNLPEKAQAHNRQLLKEVAEAAKTLPAQDAISEETAKKLLDVILKHRVAALSQLPRYDPSGLKGLCFGRACAVQWEANLNLKIPETSLRKIFIVGDMTKATGHGMQFHVATMVQGKNAEGWWVLDSEIGTPVLPSEWHRVWTKEKAREADDSELLFVTSPVQILPAPLVRLPALMGHSDFHPYFRDLLESYPQHQP